MRLVKGLVMVLDSYVYCIVGDGVCMMGVASAACVRSRCFVSD